LNKQKIQFIINPISGVGKQKKVAILINRWLNCADFDFELQYTKAPRHAIELSSKAAAKGIDIVVAVGGDGSVNEVACGLIGTPTKMAILPAGSGNGLARHLLVPRDLKLAIDILNKARSSAMDTNSVNGKYFLNTAGIGFDAHIAHLFSQYGKRGFWSYVKIIWKEFSDYQPQKYTLIADGKILEREAFLICIANSSQFGNNAVIAPKASVEDGLMDVCILRKGTVPAFAMVVFRLFNKSIDKSELLEIIQCRTLEIKNPGRKIHLDGEPMEMEENLRFDIHPASLNVIAP
jgi:diacylglycerol kinase (ATP)